MKNSKNTLVMESMNSAGENISAILFVFFGFFFLLISYLLWTEPTLQRVEFWKYMLYTFMGSGLPAILFFYLLVYSETHYEFHPETNDIVYINNMIFKITKKIAKFNDVEEVLLVTQPGEEWTSYYCDLVLKNKKKIRFTHKKYFKEKVAAEGIKAAKLMECPFR